MDPSSIHVRPGTSLSDLVARELRRDFSPSAGGQQLVRHGPLSRGARGMKRFMFATAGGVKRVSVATGRRGIKLGKSVGKLTKRAYDEWSYVESPSKRPNYTAINAAQITTEKTSMACNAFPFLTPAYSIHEILHTYLSQHPIPATKRAIPPAPARAVYVHQPTRVYTRHRPGSSHIRSSSQITASSRPYIPSFLRPPSRNVSVRCVSGVTWDSDGSSDVLGLTPIYEATGEMPSPLQRRPRIRNQITEGYDLRPDPQVSRRRSARKASISRASYVRESSNYIGDTRFTHRQTTHEQEGGNKLVDLEPSSKQRSSTAHDDVLHPISSRRRRNRVTGQVISSMSSHDYTPTEMNNPARRSQPHYSAPPIAQLPKVPRQATQTSRRYSAENDPHHLQREAARHRYTKSISQHPSSEYSRDPQLSGAINGDPRLDYLNPGPSATFTNRESANRTDSSEVRRHRSSGRPGLSVDTRLSQSSYRTSFGVNWNAPLFRNNQLPPPVVVVEHYG